MKKRYSTPEMEVEAFNIFTVFTESSTGSGGIDQERILKKMTM